MLHFIESSKLTPVIPAAQKMLELISDGTLTVAVPGSIDTAVVVADRLQEAIDDALSALESGAYTTNSPFLRHRSVILSGYCTAERLADLTLHLWNYHHPVQLGPLLVNADRRHKAIALELIASYAEHGENDPHFMNLAHEIHDLKAFAAQAA